MIYFIESQGLVKIGHSLKPELRVSKVQSDNPHPCVLIGVMDGSVADETDLHVKFAHLRHRGEWFRLSPELRQLIDGSPVVRLVDKRPEPTDPISKWMRKNRMTDRSLGRFMGVSQAQVHRVRKGKRVPSWSFLCVLYEKTGITPNEIMGVNPTPIPRHELRPDIWTSMDATTSRPEAGVNA